jgi:3-hydroxyacyl-CoA dehydrogenase
MSGEVSFQPNHEIGLILIENPPVNALSSDLVRRLGDWLVQAEREAAVRAIVIAASGAHFSAGADLGELERAVQGDTPGPDLRVLLGRIEDCAKPVVCAIQGACLGEGLELALAAHYRIAVPDARLGLPQAKLGLIPGAGGTQRLPRLIGVEAALELCWRGEPVSAEAALRLGLIDGILSGELLAGALAWVRELLARGAGPRRTRDRVIAPFDPAVFEAARAAAARAMRGQAAPLKAIDAVEAATRLAFDEGLEFEAELARACLRSDQSRALIYAFRGERAARKIPGLAPDAFREEIRRAAVVGAGTMGGGIAMAFANAGIPVVIKDASAEVLERGLEAIRNNYAVSVRRGRLSAQEAGERLGLIQPRIDYSGFEEADIIVEAVFEDLELKKQVFADLDGAARPGAILASNTSSLDIDQMAAVTRRPDRVLGLHFFNPAHVMRLLEIVRGAATSPETLAAALGLARRLGKVAVVVGNCLGFVGNRMFEQYRREAQFLVEEGASPRQVDEALRAFGMAMGPLATGDLVGLDVAYRIRKLFEARMPPGGRRPLIEDELYAMGRLGQKTGAGWYRYSSARVAEDDPEVERLIEETRRDAGLSPRPFTPQEIVERTVFALVNEGARILEEGIATRTSDIDVVWLHGFGFPAWRGGPLWYASSLGLPYVIERLAEFERTAGPHWAPAPLLGNLARQGRALID